MTDTRPSAASSGRETAVPSTAADRVFLLLRTTFVVAPIAFGLDKFVELLTDWEQYLAPWINDLVPGTAAQAMMAVGVIEVVAGLLVAWRPDIGGFVVAAWLLGIIVNLVSMGEYFDIALRDFGLMVAALSLALLATDRRRRTHRVAVTA
jgi:hypothetical protein